MVQRRFKPQLQPYAASDALKGAYNPNGYGLNVFVANSEVPVRYDYRTFQKNSDGLPTAVRYFQGGTKPSFKVSTVADVAGSLQGKYFTITSSEGSVYDIAYSSGVTLTTPNITITVPFTNGDTANTIAMSTAVMMFSVLYDFDVQVEGNELEIIDLRVGQPTAPVDVDSGFTISDIQQGSFGTLIAIRFQDYDDNMKVDMDEWVIFYDKIEKL